MHHGVWMAVFAGSMILVFAAMLYLLRPGGWSPPAKHNPDKETRMNRFKVIGGFIAVVVFVMAVLGLLLELSGWHLGETTGAILVTGLAVTFVMCWLSAEIPSGLRPALAVVAAICWLCLVIHNHIGHGPWWRSMAFIAAILGPAVLALGFDVYYNARRDEKNLRSVTA